MIPPAPLSLRLPGHLQPVEAQELRPEQLTASAPSPALRRPPFPALGGRTEQVMESAEPPCTGTGHRGTGQRAGRGGAAGARRLLNSDRTVPSLRISAGKSKIVFNDTHHPTPDRGLRWTFLSSTNIFLMTLGGGRARLCPRAWIAPNRCWGRGRGMHFPARDFLLKFKREGSFQSPLKMYFSPLNNGLLSAPGGTRLRSRFCCRRGETSGFRARKTQLRKELFPAPVIFVAQHPFCIQSLWEKK